LDIVQFSTQKFIAYTLILFRVGGIMIFAPVFGSGMVPGQTKAALAMVVALMLVPVIDYSAPEPLTLPNMVYTAATESIVGLLIGYAASLLFVAVQLGGMQIGQQMGTEIGSVFNPFLEVQSSVVGEFYFLFSTLVFLGINGHHILLAALVESFRTVPIGSAALSLGALDMLIKLFGYLFAIAFAISAPVVIALFLVTVAMGFVARTVPQMNILIVGFPVRVVVGLAVMIFTLPAIGYFLARVTGVVLRGLPDLVAAAR
jgi:flagellar biosynthetic protein FliR